jgi:hypothetical protein
MLTSYGQKSLEDEQNIAFCTRASEDIELSQVLNADRMTKRFLLQTEGLQGREDKQLRCVSEIQ